MQHNNRSSNPMWVRGRLFFLIHAANPHQPIYNTPTKLLRRDILEEKEHQSYNTGAPFVVVSLPVIRRCTDKTLFCAYDQKSA